MAVDLKKLYGEPWIYAWLLIIVAFLALDPKTQALATIYALMIIADFVLWNTTSPKINFNTTRGNTPIAVVWALIAFGVVGLLSVIITAVFNNLSLFSVNAVGGLGGFLSNNMLGSSVTFSVATNPIGIIVIWGILISIIETRFLARVIELVADVTVTDLSLKSFRTWGVFAVCTAGAVAFHFFAKGITNNTALAITGVFFLVSCVSIVYFKEIESAVYLHIVNNVAAVINGFMAVGRRII